jgi:ubiquitin-protein ligase E3 C
VRQIRSRPHSFQNSIQLRRSAMFADELGANRGKKRAEENRARRLQLKQQQQQKQAPQPVSTRPLFGSTNTAAGSSANANHHDEKPAISASTPASSAVAAVTKSPPILSPIEQAAFERQKRAEEATKRQSAATVQRYWRGGRRRLQCQEEIQSVLSQRLGDIQTLRSILAQKRSKDCQEVYVPPPAATRGLVQRLLYLTTTNGRRQRQSAPKTADIDDEATYMTLGGAGSELTSLLQRVLDLAVLPSLRTNDDNLSIAGLWLQSPEGKLRMERLIRLCIVAMTSPLPCSEEAARQSIVAFLETVLMRYPVGVTCEARLVLRNHVMNLLFPLQSAVDPFPIMAATFSPAPRTAYSTNKRLSTLPLMPYAQISATLDLVAILRYFLLFVVAGPHPIPVNLSTNGQGLGGQDENQVKVPRDMQQQAGAIFDLLVHVATSQLSRLASFRGRRQEVQLRIMTEIFTVPLLTWKLSPESIQTTTRASLSNSRPPLVQLIATMMNELNSDPTPDGASSSASLSVTKLLPQLTIPFSACPATNTQCFLANVLQFAYQCPSIVVSGKALSSSCFQFMDSALLFDLLAELVDAIPLGTFVTSRESAVEWITDDKGHSTAVILSAAVLDQCKLLLLDSFVRRMFDVAIDTEILDTEKVLATKDDTDRKREKELADAGPTAESLAAKEARADRNRSFWQNSKWAKKLKDGVTGLLTNSVEKPRLAPGGLADTSTVSRALAKQGNDGRSDLSSTGALMNLQSAYTPELLFSLCRVYAILLARWGGGGGRDITVKTTGSTQQHGSPNARKRNSAVATSVAEPWTTSLLNVLCFSTSAVQGLWGVIQSHDAVVESVQSIADPVRSSVSIRALRLTTKRNASLSSVTSDLNSDNCGNWSAGASLLFIFASSLSHVLIVTDDVEIHDMDRPLPLHQLRRCIKTLKALLHRACCLDDRSETVTANYFGLALISSASRTLRDLYDRSSRRPLAVPKLFLIPDLLEKELRQCKLYSDYIALLEVPVLRVCPYLVSFKRRLKLFERIITTNRIELQGENSANPFNPNPLKPGIPIRITRGRLLEDGLATMNHLGSSMRQRISVQYVNEAGAREVGVDAGGLFKEFWTDLSAIAFDANYALFRVTEGSGGGSLYPNPSSRAAHGADHVTLFAFLGRILGKALYEGITIHPRFAHFFLSFLRGDYNFLHMLPDLSTIDAQLYNNLMFLKTYDGDALDLSLSFTVTVDEFGGTKEIPLIPNGANIDVTNSNKQRYIGMVAKYYVVDRVREQSEAFTNGLWEVIDRSWLRLFNEPELQVLISGASGDTIDVEDMRANTQYIGGYTPIDRHVLRFWRVVGSFDKQQQSELLRFVTSCERPPPLGFGSMNPRFTIQRVGILRDGDKLPASSTCFSKSKRCCLSACWQSPDLRVLNSKTL